MYLSFSDQRMHEEERRKPEETVIEKTDISSDIYRNDEYYDNALKDGGFHLDDDTYVDPSNWKSFNDFFARRLKDPSRRPIAEADDETVVVSPADSCPQGLWNIDEEGEILIEYEEEHGIPIKTGTLSDVKV